MTQIVSPAVLIAAIVLLSAADIATTTIALRRGLTEANPLARKLFGALGVIPAGILGKLVFCAPMVALAWFYPALWYVPTAYIFLLTGLVANNLFELSGSSGSG